MTDTTRDLIQRLADELDHCKQLLMDNRRKTHPLAIEARAYLAQPEPEYPSDKELLELMPETMRDEFSYAAKVCSDAVGGRSSHVSSAWHSTPLRWNTHNLSSPAGANSYLQ